MITKNHDFYTFMLVLLQYPNEKIHGQPLHILEKPPDNLLIIHCKKNIDNYYTAWYVEGAYSLLYKLLYKIWENDLTRYAGENV